MNYLARCFPNGLKRGGKGLTPANVFEEFLLGLHRLSEYVHSLRCAVKTTGSILRLFVGIRRLQLIRFLR